MKIHALILLCMASLTFSASANIYREAVDNPNRSAKEREIDSKRKPDQVLEFFEIQPGMDVLDVFAGGGYYTEILSYLVGQKGSVTLFNNNPWQAFAAKAVEDRLKNNRLPNVKPLITKPEALDAQNKQYDAALFILGMHDLYYADPKQGWVAIDRSKFLKAIYNSLKPGAIFGVIDANAMQGVDNEKIGHKLHRVDPATLIEDVIDAGFVLTEQSDVLRNPNDDKNTSVFLPQNRYNTDRSVLKFRKI